MYPMNAAAPVRQEDRIHTIDVVRGFALLGILIMNILSFGLPEIAEWNPSGAGGATGINLAFWVVQVVLCDGKMRAIFSMCFGAGAILLTARAEGREGGSQGVNSADIYYRRLLWLLLFGMIHAYLIWHGDILYPYALLGLLLYPFRKASPRALLIPAAVMLAMMIGNATYQTIGLRKMHDKAFAAEQKLKQGGKLTKEEEGAREEWRGRMKYMQRNDAEIKKETDAYRGNYLKNLERRASNTWNWHSSPIYGPGLLDMASMMLIGMALFRLGVLTGERSVGFYAKLAALGYAIGIPLHAYGVWSMIHWNFHPLSAGFGYMIYQPARMGVALGHVSALMILVKTGALSFLTSRLAAVGQMAFSNYITHSLVCTTIFYGFGFGLFNKLERHQLYYVVAAIWVFQLIASPIWLRHFRFGPLEWCWRSLTYWSKQPMRREQPEPPQPPEAPDALEA